MPKKIQDIIKKQEKPQNQENSLEPGKMETMPGSAGIEKKIEMPMPEEEVAPKPEISEQPEVALPKEVAAPAQTQTALISPEIEKIEDILEEDLEDVYFKLPPEKQAQFREQGEKTASKIAVLLKEAHIKVKKILELIRDWLKIIPGINKFFLEQEAKIKTDKILDINEPGDDSQQNQNKI